MIHRRQIKMYLADFSHELPPSICHDSHLHIPTMNEGFSIYLAIGDKLGLQ